MTRVVVAGAGIGGLTLGIALARAGVQVDLYEQADELREVGAAVALSANGTRELYRLGVGEALDAVSTQPTELIYRDGRSGARIAAHPGADAYRERFGAPYWGVHRVDLQQTLAGAFTAAAGEEHLHLGRAVTAVDAEAGTLTLADGHAMVAGDVVVGADGVHSTVRDAVTGPGLGSRLLGHQRLPRPRARRRAAEPARPARDPVLGRAGRAPPALRAGSRRRHRQLLRRALRPGDVGGRQPPGRGGRAARRLRRLAPRGARDARRGAAEPALAAARPSRR